jgi:hypothetical protein
MSRKVNARCWITGEGLQKKEPRPRGKPIETENEERLNKLSYLPAMRPFSSILGFVRK